MHELRSTLETEARQSLEGDDITALLTAALMAGEDTALPKDEHHRALLDHTERRLVLNLQAAFTTSLRPKTRADMLAESLRTYVSSLEQLGLLRTS